MEEEVMSTAYRIIDTLRGMDACEEGVRYVRRLLARSPQEVWDRCNKPYFMTWYLGTLLDEHYGGERGNRVTTARLTSLAVALLRAGPRHSVMFYEFVDRIAVLNRTWGDREGSLEGFDNIREEVSSHRSEGTLGLYEGGALRSLCRVANDYIGIGDIVEYGPVIHSRETGAEPDSDLTCRFIRIFFPIVPLPGEIDQTDEVEEQEEG